MTDSSPTAEASFVVSKSFLEEMNELLIAIGATSQQNLPPNLLASMSSNYRTWKLRNPREGQKDVKPKQYWYAIIHVINPGGGMNIVKLFTEEHPVDFAEKNIPGSIVNTMYLIPEGVYLEHKDPKAIIRA